MVRQWQEFFYEERYIATPMINPDFVKLADAYGIPAIRVTHARTRSRRRCAPGARASKGPGR